MQCFQLAGYVDHALAGGDHIVYNDNIFAGYVAAEELMGNDGIASVDDACIVTSFVKHTHINTENICQINSTAPCRLHPG